MVITLGSDQEVSDATSALGLGSTSGQGWEQVGYLALAVLLASVIGLERELRQKSAGLRTQAVVGLGAAVFVLISKYGFTDVLIKNQSMVDPSRVASLIVSGIGFIGAGLIFVQREHAVRGLTTAASVWLTAAVGAAAGAGLWLIAIVATAFYLVAVRGLTPVSRYLGARSGRVGQPAEDHDAD